MSDDTHRPGADGGKPEDERPGASQSDAPSPDESSEGDAPERKAESQAEATEKAEVEAAQTAPDESAESTGKSSETPVEASAPTADESAESNQANGQAPAMQGDAGRKRSRLGFPVVGVGASAGGLQAFSALLKRLPSNPGFALVFVQHLAPEHESNLTQILSRATDLPVHEAADGTAIECDQVYVIPPNRDLAVIQGKLQLMSRPATPRRRLDRPGPRPLGPCGAFRGRRVPRGRLQRLSAQADVAGGVGATNRPALAGARSVSRDRPRHGHCPFFGRGRRRVTQRTGTSP